MQNLHLLPQTVSQPHHASGIHQINGLEPPHTKYKVTTDGDHTFNIAPNLLDQDVTADGPNQKWAGDISYIWTSEGWLYLAVILDLYSRRVIALRVLYAKPFRVTAWAVSNRMKQDLAIRALDMAVALRQPPEGCIHHTDRGSQSGFNRSSQHPILGGVDDKNRPTKIRTFDTGQIRLARKAANLAT
jgi:transposase InsO family protein